MLCIVRLATLALSVSIAAQEGAPVAPKSDTAAAKAAAALFRVDRLEIDAGKLAAGEQVELEFVVTNDGDVPLRISAKSTCTCTTIQFDPLIAPHETGKIHVELRTKGLRSGATAKFVAVTTNDPKKPFVPLIVKADIAGRVRVVEPEPSAPILLPRTGGFVQQVQLVAGGVDPVEISGLGCDAEFVVASISEREPRDANTNAYRLRLEFGPDAPFGRSMLTVLAATNSLAERVVALKFVVEKGIVATPNRIVLINNPKLPESPQTGVVTLSSRDGKFQIKKIGSRDFEISSQIDEVRPGQEYRILLFHRVLKRIAGPGIIRIETDDPLQPVIEVPAQCLSASR